MAQTSQEPGPTGTSTAEKCSSRQTGSASCNVNMLKYHCCWMQLSKWVCMLKFEQTSSKVRLSGSQQGFWKFEVAMGHQHPHGALLGWHQCSARPQGAHSTLSMHYWPHWVSHRITHPQSPDYQLFIYILKLQTENALVFLHLQSAISGASSSNHACSEPRSCFPAHSSWSQVLLSAVPAQLFMPYRLNPARDKVQVQKTQK